jgi:Na+/H+ antiporter NhaD/arsenite permease-like protein
MFFNAIVDQVGTHGRALENTYLEYNEYGSSDSTAVSAIYIAIACTIFVLLAAQLLFPSNRFLPIDRRTSSISCAVLVYCSHKFLLKNEADVDLIDAVDFDVLLLLSGIMIINHLIVHLKETKRVIRQIQALIQENPLRGFWMRSFVALVVSPFLTNDGVCLLFVAPILATFEDLPAHKSGEESLHSIEEGTERKKLLDGFNLRLQSSDAVYFMLTLACSANIGSALTYTGNPQNMIVASDSLGVMPPIKFLYYMFLPTILSWLGTTWYISHCWVSSNLCKFERSEPIASAFMLSGFFKTSSPILFLCTQGKVSTHIIPARKLVFASVVWELRRSVNNALSHKAP